MNTWVDGCMDRRGESVRESRCGQLDVCRPLEWLVRNVGAQVAGEGGRLRDRDGELENEWMPLRTPLLQRQTDRDRQTETDKTDRQTDRPTDRQTASQPGGYVGWRCVNRFPPRSSRRTFSAVVHESTPGRDPTVGWNVSLNPVQDHRQPITASAMLQEHGQIMSPTSSSTRSS